MEDIKTIDEFLLPSTFNVFVPDNPDAVVNYNSSIQNTQKLKIKNKPMQ